MARNETGQQSAATGSSERDLPENALAPGEAFGIDRKGFIANHEQEALRRDTFPQFPKLSAELRLMIWEHTWPAARMIEGAICTDETVDPDDYKDIAILRVLGPLSEMLAYKIEERIVEEDPVEARSMLVALHVCHESRMHTLSAYRLFTHSATVEGSFYYNPLRDVVWFSFDFTDEDQYIRELEQCYGEQLNAVQTVLVQEWIWHDWKPVNFSTQFLYPFGGLKTILHLMDDVSVDEVGPGTARERLLKLVNGIKTEYSMYLRDGGMGVEDFRCIDRSLTLY